MGYTLEQLKSMGAVPVTQTNTSTNQPKKSYTSEELKSLGAQPYIQQTPQIQQPIKTDNRGTGQKILEGVGSFAGLDVLGKTIAGGISQFIPKPKVIAPVGQNQEDFQKKFNQEQNASIREDMPTLGQNVGAGLKLASTVIPAGKLVKGGLALKGAISGGTYGVGQGMVDKKSAGGVVAYGVSGAAGGALLGKILPEMFTVTEDAALKQTMSSLSKFEKGEAPVKTTLTGFIKRLATSKEKEIAAQARPFLSKALEKSREWLKNEIGRISQQETIPALTASNKIIGAAERKLLINELNKVSVPSIIKGDPTRLPQFNSYMNTVKSVILNSKDKLSLYKNRIFLDNTIDFESGGKVFDAVSGIPNPVYLAYRQARTIVNKFLIEGETSGVFKEGLKKQTNLYNALDGVKEQIASKLGKPTAIGKTIKKIGVGVGVGAGIGILGTLGLSGLFKK
jgi:hypothetical protein